MARKQKYIVVRHHLEDGNDTFKTAAFSSREKAERSMREDFANAVGCFKAEGFAFDAADTYCDGERAWIILSHNDRDERQWHITECEEDADDYSRSAYLD